jgi:hypothetical protein
MPAGTSLTEVTALATNTANSTLAMASDFLIVLVLFSILILFATRVGRGPFVASLLAFYAAYAVYLTFPFMSFLPSAPALTAVLSRAGLFVGLSVVFYIILRRVVVSDFLYIGLMGIFLLALLATGFIIAMGYHVFAVPTVYQFTPAIDALFASKDYFFWWFIAPAVGLFFIAR